MRISDWSSDVCSSDLQRAALDLAGDQQQVKPPQRVACVGALQIVLGPEQALPAGLTLALGDGAEGVEPARDGGEEALSGLHIGGDRPEQRRLRLIGAVGAAKLLNGGVGLPPGLEQVRDVEPKVHRRKRSEERRGGKECVSKCK